MRQVGEVLRLKFAGGAPTLEIARRLGVAPSTVRATLRRFAAAGLTWPLPDDITDEVLEAKLFGNGEMKQSRRRQEANPAGARLMRRLRPGPSLRTKTSIGNWLGFFR
jgi:transposase-like protein